MKNRVLSLLALVILGITSCQKSDEVGPKDDPKKEFTQDLQQAKQWLPGKWKLDRVYAMLLNAPVPNVELVIDAKQIRLIQNGNQVDVVDYEIVKVNNKLQIQTSAQLRETNWYVQNPGLQINRDRLYLDLARAQEGAGYEFKRVN
ncbi:hypothetical protein [Larkinella rosea]|uniref:Lipocalin-like domain-containing protein n=1 Tax=Larkinella rosea TaxID=2025312 RepID=A0A3P1BZF3_9BACT|nr:hypothetical protein [Larkinella rosea]RRB06457.1 hypothetical protein EHT25_01250 [Larkinella rosea]